MSSSVSFIAAVGADLRSARHAIELLSNSLQISVIDEIVVVYAERAGQAHALPPLPRRLKVKGIELMMLCESEDGDLTQYSMMQNIIRQRLRAHHRVHLCVANDESMVPAHALLIGARCLRPDDGLWLLEVSDRFVWPRWRLRSLPIHPIDASHTNNHARHSEFLNQRLSARERMVVQHLVQGRLSNREIGARMNISEHRVEKILSEQIYPQLRIFLGRAQVNRQDLVAEFTGLFDSDRR